MFKSEKILITGIAGFIGKNLAHYLSKKGYEVCGIDIKAPPEFSIDVEVVDITQPIKKLPEHDLIIHLAGSADVGRSYADPLHDFKCNVAGTLNLLEYNRKNGNNPVIFASSYRVNPVDIQGTRSIYGCGKLACELYLKEYQCSFGTPVIVNRLSCIYGEGQIPNKQGWVSLFSFSKIKELPVNVSGDGTQVRDCLYIGDLLRLIELQIKERRRCNGHIYNIGGGKDNAFSLLELINFLDENFPEYRPLNVNRIPEGKSFKNYVSDISSVEWLWKPEISVWEGINKTFKWLEQNADTFV